MSDFWSRLRRSSTITRADQAMLASQWDAAVRLYRKVLERNPNKPGIWVQYGHALKEMGQLGPAEEAYKSALFYAPGDADAQLQLAHLLRRQNRIEEAKAAYFRLMETNDPFNSAMSALSELGCAPSNSPGRQEGDQVAPSANAATTDRTPDFGQENPHKQLNEYSFEDLVHTAYRGVLKRDAEPRGLVLYSNALRHGMTLAQLIAELIQTSEFYANVGATLGSGPQLAEVRRLASGMESAMLTLAISAAPRAGATWLPDQTLQPQPLLATPPDEIAFGMANVASARANGISAQAETKQR